MFFVYSSSVNVGMNLFSDYIATAEKTIQKAMGDSGFITAVESASRSINACIKAGRKIMVAGNGGSAADAQHFAAEVTGRYKRERVGLPAVALTTDSSVITAIANDYGFTRVFSRQVEAMGNEGDVLILISTSGNSENLVHAAVQAKKDKIFTVALLGKDGGMLKEFVDVPVIVPSDTTSHIQELHLMTYHYWSDMLEQSIV